jgi:hypothetical protein
MAAAHQPKFSPQVSTAAKKFFSLYSEFVTKLAEVYPTDANLESHLVDNSRKLILVEDARVAQAIVLAKRWTNMVADTPEGFAQHSEVMLATNSVRSVLCDLGVHDLVTGSDANKATFRKIRDAFWRYVDKLTDQAQKLIAIAPDLDADGEYKPDHDFNANMSKTLSDLKLPLIHDHRGRAGVDIAAMFDPRNPTRSLEGIKGILKANGLPVSIIDGLAKQIEQERVQEKK